MANNDTPSGAIKNPDQLTGWKEIASYLDKAVRTVQRWEPELGMPVHRIGIRGSETLFAFKSELDAWRAGGEVRQLTDSNGGGEAAGDYQDDGRWSTDSTEGALGSRSDSSGSPGNRRRSLAKVAVWTLAAIGIVVIALVLGIGWRREPSSTADRTPSRWRVDDNGFHGFNAAGVELWSKTFDFKLSPPAYEASTDPMAPSSVEIRDIDGDGRPEVLLITKPTSSDSPMALYCFGSDGVERWRHQVTRTVNYGSLGSPTKLRPHRPPFMPMWLWVLDVGARTPEVWAVARHGQEFPSVLQRFDPSSGQVLQEYWSNGDIILLTSQLLGGRRHYFVGGVKNEDQQASLAVFDSKGPRGFAPAEDPYYACQDCGTGHPLIAFAFPRTEITRLYGHYPFVEAVAVRGGDLWATVRHNGGRESDGHLPFLRASAVYHFDSSFRLIEAEFPVEYQAFHQRLEKSRVFDHPYDRAHERELWPVGRWDGRRWAKILAPEAPLK